MTQRPMPTVPVNPEGLRAFQQETVGPMMGFPSGHRPLHPCRGGTEGGGKRAFPSIGGSHPERRQSCPHRPQGWRSPF